MFLNHTKNHFTFSFLIVSFLVLTFSSCQKSDPVTPTVNEVFSLLNAELIEEVFPEPSGKESNQPVISNIAGNSSILAGGSNLLTVTFEDPQDDAEFVYVSMEGEDGYYRSPISSNDNISLTMLLDQDLIQNALALYFSIADKKGNISEIYTVPVTRIEAGTGNLQVSLSWDIDNDIDLHLVQPNGEEIYYANDESSTSGLLDIDSNAGCFLDGVRNENITYGDDAVVLAGDYIVRVDFYDECVFGGAETNFSVITYLEGNIVATSSGSNPFTGSFTSGTADLGDEGSGVDIMKFNVPQQIGKKEIVLIDYGFTARKRKAANHPKLK